MHGGSCGPGRPRRPCGRPIWRQRPPRARGSGRIGLCTTDASEMRAGRLTSNPLTVAAQGTLIAGSWDESIEYEAARSRCLGVGRAWAAPHPASWASAPEGAIPAAAGSLAGLVITGGRTAAGLGSASASPAKAMAAAAAAAWCGARDRDQELQESGRSDGRPSLTEAEWADFASAAAPPRGPLLPANGMPSTCIGTAAWHRPARRG